MQFTNPFDARQYEPQLGFPAPPLLADYHVVIVEAEGKPVKPPGQGGYLELVLEILDPGPYLKRRVKYILNIFNDSPQTVEIAHKQLSAICHVTNQFDLRDSRQLCNVPFIATIGPDTKQGQENYPRIFGVKDINGAEPGKAGQFAAQPPAPPVVAAAPPTWAPQPTSPPVPVWQPPAATPPPAQPGAPTWAQAAPAAVPGKAPWEK